MKLFAVLTLLIPSLSWAALPVIDVHTHTGFSGKPEETSKIIASKEQYLKELTEINAVAAVSLAHSGVRELDPELQKFPVIQCYGVREKVNLAEIEATLKSKQARCLKIYLGYVHRWAYDKAYRPLYSLAAKYDMPVVFHTGDTYSRKAKLKYADPLTIDEVAVDFPQTTFVIAHLGNPWIESAMEVVYKNPNVYVEASAMLIGDIFADKEMLEDFLVKPIRKAFRFIENPNKLLFGTDWPLVSMKDYLAAYKKAIPEKHWCKVFFENAVRVFRLKEVENKYQCP